MFSERWGNSRHYLYLCHSSSLRPYLSTLHSAPEHLDVGNLTVCFRQRILATTIPKHSILAPRFTNHSMCSAQIPSIAGDLAASIFLTFPELICTLSSSSVSSLHFLARAVPDNDIILAGYMHLRQVNTQLSFVMSAI